MFVFHQLQIVAIALELGRAAGQWKTSMEHGDVQRNLHLEGLRLLQRLVMHYAFQNAFTDRVLK